MPDPITEAGGLGCRSAALVRRSVRAKLRGGHAELFRASPVECEKCRFAGTSDVGGGLEPPTFGL